MRRGDRFEQEADAVSKSVTSSSAAPSVQRTMPEVKEDELSRKSLQRQSMDEDEMAGAGAEGAAPEDEMTTAQAQPMPGQEEEKV